MDAKTEQNKKQLKMTTKKNNTDQSQIGDQKQCS